MTPEHHFDVWPEPSDWPADSGPWPWPLCGLLSEKGAVAGHTNRSGSSQLPLNHLLLLSWSHRSLLEMTLFNCPACYSFFAPRIPVPGTGRLLNDPSAPGSGRSPRISGSSAWPAVSLGRGRAIPPLLLPERSLGGLVLQAPTPDAGPAEAAAQPGPRVLRLPITWTLQMAHVSHSTSQLHMATAFHFLRENILSPPDLDPALPEWEDRAQGSSPSSTSAIAAARSRRRRRWVVGGGRLWRLRGAVRRATAPPAGRGSPRGSRTGERPRLAGAAQWHHRTPAPAASRCAGSRYSRPQRRASSAGWETPGRPCAVETCVLFYVFMTPLLEDVLLIYSSLSNVNALGAGTISWSSPSFKKCSLGKGQLFVEWMNDELEIWFNGSQIFWSRDPFTLKNYLRTFKNFCLCRMDVYIYTLIHMYFLFKKTGKFWIY